MALKKTVTTPQGFESVDAYHRVDGISFVGKNKMVFGVTSHKTSNSPEFARTSFSCDYNMSSENPFQQAYSYLKSLDTFSDATDC